MNNPYDPRPEGEFLLRMVMFQPGEESISAIVTTTEIPHANVSHGYTKIFQLGHLDSSAQAQFFMGVLESEIRGGQFRRDTSWTWFPNTPLLKGR